MSTKAQFFILLILVIAGVVVAGGKYFDTAKLLASATFSFSEERAPESPYRIEEYIIEKGDAWGALVEKLEINAAAGLALLSASEADGVHSLTDIKAGNPLALYFDKETGELVKLAYDIDSDFILVIEREGDGYAGRKERIEYDVRAVVAQGTIESSLYETAVALGVPDKVILDMAWVFSWDIDFASSIREGDSFIVAYEDRFRDGKRVKPGRVLAAQFINDKKEFYSFYYTNPEGTGDYYDAEGKELKRQFLKSPLDYRKITSGFSYNRYNPILETFTRHRAIDYGAAPGTPVSVTANGTVAYASWKGQHGNHVEVRHANGYTTGYSHLSSIARGVYSGARVTQNQVIGFVGSTGLSTGPHLHYEMKKNGALINPLTLDLPPGQPLKEEWLPDFESKKKELIDLLGV
jgi:murein DD-endopeptidase MepM/ murein hydrolase activator NlpD